MHNCQYIFHFAGYFIQYIFEESWYSIILTSIFVFIVFSHRLEYFPHFFDLPIKMTRKISLLLVSLPKIVSRLVERFVTRVEDKFDRRWQSRFRGEKNWHPLRGESFLSPPSRLDTMKHVLVSRDRLFSTDTSNLLSWNIPDALCKIFLEDFFK